MQYKDQVKQSVPNITSKAEYVKILLIKAEYVNILSSKGEQANISSGKA